MNNQERDEIFGIETEESIHLMQMEWVRKIHVELEEMKLKRFFRVRLYGGVLIEGMKIMMNYYFEKLLNKVGK